MTKIIIQGAGVVGQATELFLTAHNQDLNIEFNDPAKGIVVEDSEWATADYVIVCVNTDLDTTLAIAENSTANVDTAINQALQNKFAGKVVLRSTCGIDSIAALYTSLGQNLIVWPEYIVEASWKQDATKPRFVIVGGDETDDFANLFNEYTGTTFITDAIEAMIAKLSTNAFLAMKVTFANQLEKVCQSVGAHYPTVAGLLKNEGRLGASHWDVPGPDGQFGFGGKCFPKDIKTFEAALIKAGQHIDLIRGVSDINNTLRSNEK